MPEGWILFAIVISGALGYLALALMVITHQPPPSVKTMWQIIELFAQLTDAQQEIELAMLRERVKWHKENQL